MITIHFLCLPKKMTISKNYFNTKIRYLFKTKINYKNNGN